MPRNCSVPGCNSNNRRFLKNNKAVSTYSFPKQDDFKATWTRKIRRSGNWQPSPYSAVCELHFEEKDFKPKSSSSEIRKLKLDSVPSIFESFPPHLKPVKSVERTDPKKRAERLLEREQEKHDLFFKENNITSFEQFVGAYKTKLSFDGYIAKEFPTTVAFFIVDESEKQGLVLNRKIIVNSKLKIQIFIGQNQLKKIEGVYEKDMTIKFWSELDTIFSQCKNSEEIDEENDFQAILDETLILMSKLIAVTENDFDKEKLKIILGQLKLYQTGKLVYGNTLLILAFIIFSHSKSTYTILTSFFKLPTVRHLQRLTSNFHLSPNIKTPTNDEQYFHFLSQNFKDTEKYVMISIDEIHVSKLLQFKGNNLFGYSFNNPTQLATSIVAFMVSCPFSNKKEIVRLIPVSNLTGDLQMQYLEEVIKMVQSNKKVIVILVMTDNHKINRLMFLKLAEANLFFFKNPDYESFIYIAFDPVHLIKSIRNNWLNSLNRTFVYPDLETFEIKFAKFNDIVDIYQKEHNKIIKSAPKLNFKTIHPNSIERQNVNLALNIFDNTTFASLLKFGKDETAGLVEIIISLWNILNTKSYLKGKLKRNPLSEPITSFDSAQINHLKKVLNWVNIWMESSVTGNPQTLTNETFTALSITLKSLIQVVKMALDFPEIKFVLLGKFQSDNLEGRFRLYRQLSGCNYNVSVTEILESEKKIRINQILKNPNWRSEFQNGDSEYSLAEDISLHPFDSIFGNENYANEILVNLSEENIEYISGFAAAKVLCKLECNQCQKMFVVQKGGAFSNEYIRILQRGGLVEASLRVKLIFIHINNVFEKIIADDVLKQCFFGHKNQKGILLNLAIISVSKDADINIYENCIKGHDAFTYFNKILITFCNIFLNNYVKLVNNKTNANCKKRIKNVNNNNSRKISKLMNNKNC